MSEPGNRAARRLVASVVTKLGGRVRPRTEQPVWRHSRYRGERERTFWRPVDPLEHRAILEAAKLELVATKEKGKRMGTISRSDIAILECLASKVDWATGALEVAYRYIQAQTGLAIDTIWKGLKRLRAAGYLEWLRRSEPVEDDGSGIYIRQIENAYRLTVPPSWADRVRMRVAQWRARAEKAGERWRDRVDVEAAAQQRRKDERRTRTIAWAQTGIADPARRADFIASLDD